MTTNLKNHLLNGSIMRDRTRCPINCLLGSLECGVVAVGTGQKVRRVVLDDNNFAASRTTIFAGSWIKPLSPVFIGCRHILQGSGQ